LSGFSEAFGSCEQGKQAMYNAASLYGDDLFVAIKKLFESRPKPVSDSDHTFFLKYSSIVMSYAAYQL